MRRVLALYRSSIGKKVVMAVTGFILFLFMIGHTAGNLKIYQGQDKLDSYAIFLREMGHEVFGHAGLLWVLRITLLAAVVLHILAAYQLTRMSHAARPVRYAKQVRIESTYAARTMRWGGVIILLFIIFHLMDLTFGSFRQDFDHSQVYYNTVTSFQHFGISTVYIVGMIVLGLHLYHGAWSMLQTLGINNPKYNTWRRTFAAVFAIAIAVLNISIPVAVLVGWVS